MATVTGLTNGRAGSAVRRWLIGGCAFVLLVALGAPPAHLAARSEAEPRDEVPTWHPRVLARYPHDPMAYIQGLLLHQGYFYESTGLYGQSSLRKVVPETGQVVQKIDVPETYFAEGLERVGDKLWQITWKENIAFQYDLATFKKEAFAHYDGEGWGLCRDDTHPGGPVLFMSDGSPTLTLRSPTTFEPLSQLVVTENGEPKSNLNELECVGDSIYANIWLTPTIARIDKLSGKITAIIDATELDLEAEKQNPDAEVLNGITYNPATGHFYITGKRWPTLYEVVWEGPGAGPPTPAPIFLPLNWRKK